MEEFIEVTDNKGMVRKARVILRFYERDNDKYYIVYERDRQFFAARYEDSIGTSKLDTNLSKEEIMKLEKLLNEIER